MPSTKIQQETEVSRKLKDIFNRLIQDIEDAGGKGLGVSLCIFNAAPGGKINYISNCDRKDVAGAWASMMQGWNEGMPDIPAHKSH